MQILAVDGHSRPGRPRNTWEHVIMEDLGVKGLSREVAQNREPMLAWNNNGLKNDDDDDDDDDDGDELLLTSELVTPSLHS